MVQHGDEIANVGSRKACVAVVKRLTNSDTVTGVRLFGCCIRFNQALFLETE